MLWRSRVCQYKCKKEIERMVASIVGANAYADTSVRFFIWFSCSHWFGDEWIAIHLHRAIKTLLTEFECRVSSIVVGVYSDAVQFVWHRFCEAFLSSRSPRVLIILLLSNLDTVPFFSVINKIYRQIIGNMTDELVQRCFLFRPKHNAMYLCMVDSGSNKKIILN